MHDGRIPDSRLRPRPWRPPRCPHCRRPVHRVPLSNGHTADLTLYPLVRGYTFAPHVCPPAGARWPLCAVVEGPPLRGEEELLTGGPCD